MRERDPQEEGASSRAAASDSILIPRALVITLILGMPSTIGGAAWYLASQASDSHHLAEIQSGDAKRLTDAVTAARADMAAQQQSQGFIIKQTSDAIARLDHDQNETITRIDLRLTRLEAQMNFLIGAGAPARRP